MTVDNESPEYELKIYKCLECEPTRLWMNRKKNIYSKCTKKTCGLKVAPMQPELLDGKERDLFEGKLRCFGHYKCKDCKRNWSSANSWADRGQECTICEEMIFAHSQRPLGGGGGRQGRPPHEKELCQKCNDVSSLCSKLDGFHMRDVKQLEKQKTETKPITKRPQINI